MPTDRVLVEIVTAANMAGVNEAKAGFLGMSASTLGLAAALGVLVFAGKAAIANTESMDKANRSLKQAAEVSKISFGQLKGAFDAWAEANKRYIPDQYAAETALAAFVRAGANAKDAMRELNDALDLSTLRSLDLGDAQKQITLALTGSSKALKVLGITTAEYNAIVKDKTLTTEEQHLKLLALIESKTKDGRKAQTDLTQSTQAMNKDWQDISTRVGPPLLGLLTFLADQADRFIQALNTLGANKDWNKAVSDGLGHIQFWLDGVIRGFKQIVDFINWITGHKAAELTSGLGSIGKGGATGARAGGGQVSAGGAYLVGERGPEMLQMGSSSGNISPNRGGGSQIHIHIDQGAYIDGPSIDRLANLILQRAGYAPGT